MKRILWVAATVLLVLVAAFYALNAYIYNEKQADAGPVSYKDITFTISGRPVTLVDGYAEEESAPGSESKTITRYFGNYAEGDFSGDGVSDIAFLVTQESGGSGTFYYLVGAIMTDDGYRGTQAAFIGDRIAPQTTEFKDGLVIVNFAERAPGEPMTAEPSVGKSLYLKYNSDSNDFGEVIQDFEGEADPARMTLDMKSWTWLSSEEAGVSVKPKKAGAFTLTFESGNFSATTDCNSMSGSYTSNGMKIDFGPIASTKMYCEGSQESQFASMLERADSYRFTSRGEFILNYAGNSATFR